MKLRPHLIVALAGLAVATAAQATTEEGAASYAVRLPIMPAKGASLQRLDVPAQALVASREAGLADLRIFDGQGRPLSIALSTLSAPRAHRTVRLDALPILGAADALAVTGVSLRIDAGRTSVVRVQGVPVDVAAAKLLGVLFDTRSLTDPAGRLRLEAVIPRGQPIAFTVESSLDLRNWDSLGETTLYDAGGGMVTGMIDLSDAPLAGRYLRVTWSPSTGVSVRGAGVTMMLAADPLGWPRAVIRPASVEAKAITFTLPFTTPVAALEVATSGGDAVIPVRILGRNDREQPWTPIAAGSVFSVTTNNVVRRNPPFDLAGTAFRTLRIEAEAPSAGFAAPPVIAVRFSPARVLFLASGPPPFTLAVGRSGAAPAYLPAASLIPGYNMAAEAALPAAAVMSAPDPVIEAAAEEGGGRQKLVLWGVLLIATIFLAAMIWRLLHERKPA